jgi:hypothetical protein
MKAFLTESTMNEESILKRTLILTGKLVGIFSIWVALVSVVATLAAGRMIHALSGGATDPSTVAPPDTTKKDDSAASRVKHLPVTAVTKPNG